MKKKILMSLMAFVLIFSATGCSTKQSTNGKIDIKDEISVKEAKETYGIDSQELTDGINLINTFDAAWIHKSVTNSEINPETRETINMEDILNAYSVISIKDKTDITYHDENFYDRTDFKETFGFDYKKDNYAWDIFYDMYSADGVSITTEDTTLDINAYLSLEEKYFLLNNPELATEKIIKNLDYDKIISSTVNFEVGTYQNGNKQINYIDGVYVKVVYEKNGKQYAYEVIYEINLMNNENMNKLIMALSSDMGDCSCDSDSGCNTGTNEPCESECDMPDKIE